MKYIFLILLLICNISQAHKVIGGNENRTLQDIKIIENYYHHYDGIVLNRELVILNVFGSKRFKEELEKNKIVNAKLIAKRAQAVTSRNNLIIINTAGLSDTEYLFYLAHEITHQYQYQLLGNSFTDDMVYLEGSADIMASKISGQYIEIIDKKIPYDSIKDYHSFINYKHSPDHIYQARYYMRNIKSIKIKNNNILYF